MLCIKRLCCLVKTVSRTASNMRLVVSSPCSYQDQRMVFAAQTNNKDKDVMVQNEVKLRQTVPDCESPLHSVSYTIYNTAFHIAPITAHDFHNNSNTFIRYGRVFQFSAPCNWISYSLWEIYWILSIIWDMKMAAPCSTIEVNRRFRVAYCLHHQDHKRLHIWGLILLG
jgi:hypothetical protein